MWDWGSMSSADQRRLGLPRIGSLPRAHRAFQRWPCVWRPRRSLIVRIRMCCCILFNPTNAALLKAANGISQRRCMVFTYKKCVRRMWQVYRSHNLSSCGTAPGSMTPFQVLVYSGAIKGLSAQGEDDGHCMSLLV